MKVQHGKRSSRGIACVLAASLLVSSTLAPRRAEAGWGLIFMAVSGSSLFSSVSPIAIVFFVGAAGGGLTSVEMAKRGFRSSPGAALTLYLVAALSAVAALYLLDAPEDAGASPRLAPVSDETSRKLGLTPSEQQAFNSELDLVQAVVEEAMLRSENELSSKDPASLNAEEVVRVARTQWVSLSEGALSAESIRAFEKISKSMGEAR
jgi:hypothetical protein